MVSVMFATTTAAQAADYACLFVCSLAGLLVLIYLFFFLVHFKWSPDKVVLNLFLLDFSNSNSKENKCYQFIEFRKCMM